MFTAAAPPLNLTVEFLKLATYLLSPPASPSLPTSISTSSPHSSSTTRLACPSPSLVARISRLHKTPYYYPEEQQDKQSERMSQGTYAGWPSGVKGSNHDQYSGNPQGSMTASRRSGSTDQQAASFAYDSYVQQGDHRRLQSRTGVRAHSSSTSSLSGAMGDAPITVQPRASVTPPSGLASWTPSPTSSTMSGGTAFMAVPDDMTYIPVTPITSASPSGAFASYPQYNVPMYHSPETSPGLPSAGYADEFTYQQSRGHSVAASSAMIITPSTTPAPSRHSHSPHDKDDEIRRLYQRIRELELVAESSRRRIRELETEVSRGGYTGGLPSPLPTPQPPPTFNEEWKKRTEARVKMFCSLNRAGNALCAWHDSRRERREFPPRMAPHGYLNCGCTHEEALFEESLSRHGVGSYHPGESVRMDPALRNPLLRLLQQRYGYRDGDFERDPVSGSWVEGEGALHWQRKAESGASYRRNRTETDRR